VPPRVVAVVLAAGAGSRFGGPTHKLAATLPATDGEPAMTVLERSLRHVLAAEVGPVIVITGADAEVVPADLRPAVTTHHNPSWARGQATSVAAALTAVGELGADAAVVGLGDQPGVTPGCWRAVAAAGGPIAVAVYRGRRANPVKLERSIWPLVPLTGDEGARALMRVRPDLVVEVPCSGSPDDIDTEEDLRRWPSN
jgi:CTP:molybdopterin cytidylyltransferase MocA